MAYNWSSLFGQNYRNANMAYDEYQKDIIRAELERQALREKFSLEQAQKIEEYNRELELLRKSAEYAQATNRQKASLEAQLYALKKGYLPEEMASALASGASPEEIQKMAMKDMNSDSNISNPASVIGGVAGGIAGMASPAYRGAISSALKGAGSFANQGIIGKTASIVPNLASAGLHTGARVSSDLAGKTSSSALQKILGGASKVGTSAGTKASGLAGILSKGSAEKGIGKILTKVGTKAGAKGLGRLGSAAVGGVPGLIGGFVVGEILDRIINSDDEDEKERARQEYIRGMYY